MKKKILVISFKYTVAEDRSGKITKALLDSSKYNVELVKCLGSKKIDTLIGQIREQNYKAVFIVWEYAFNEDEIETFVLALRQMLPKLKMIAASNRPGCRQMLMEAGCDDEFETSTNPKLFSRNLLDTIKKK